MGKIHQEIPSSKQTKKTPQAVSSAQLLDATIVQLERFLGLKAGECVTVGGASGAKYSHEKGQPPKSGRGKSGGSTEGGNRKSLRKESGKKNISGRGKPCSYLCL